MSLHSDEHYFHHYAALSEQEALDMAYTFWDAINGMNLSQHILPSKHLADLIVVKNQTHHIEDILIRH